MNYQEATDEQLLQAYYDGDNRAIEELLKRHFERLARFAFQRLQRLPWDLSGRKEEAENTVQEAFLKVLATKGRPSNRWTPEGGASVQTWLRTFVYNLLVSKYVRPKHKPPSSFPVRLDEDGEAYENSIPGREPDASIYTESEDTKKALLECVDKLPDRLRSLCLLKYWEGLTQEAIAEAWNRSGPTVSRLNARMEELLKDCLKNKGIEST